MTLALRSATPADAGIILGFIRDLAEYEHLAHEVVATVEAIARDLGGEGPRIYGEIADLDDAPVGFALWFYSYSTFQGRFGLYLEDLYVKPQARGHGIGKALFARLARRCTDEGLGRMGWAVLDWNAPSIGFYKSLGAVMTDEWTGCRLDGEALAALAGS